MVRPGKLRAARDWRGFQSNLLSAETAKDLKANWIDSLLSGAGLAVVYLLLAGWFFRRVFRNALRTGILARYSAENLG